MRLAAYLLLPGISYEQLPRPLVEAFAHGLPAIASRVERLAEMVEPGRNGLLFEPGSARELARRLLTENESTYIPPGTRHRLENPGKLPLEIIEVQSGTYLGEDDIVRFDDAYGRA
jgi:glycosyltransferase involved in cell wall biosynthesis